MDLMPESVEEFRAAEHSLLLDEAELSSLKSKIEAEAPTSKKSKKRDQGALSPVITKRKATPADFDTSTVPMKKVKCS